MSINIIAAIGLNRELGQNNNLLCNLSADLKHFKKITENNFCVMGRNTFESIGKALPNRTNIVLSRDVNYDPHPAVHVYSSFDDVLWEYENYAEKQIDLFIIGGGQLYSQAIKHANKMFITVIQNKFPEADTHFPAFELSEWNHRVTGYQKKDDKNEYPFYYVEYTRK